MKFRRSMFFILILILLTGLACAVPGVSTVSNPAPSTDPGLLNTIVAETVAAAIVQTQRASESLSSPTIVIPATETPAPVNAPLEPGSTLSAQNDGTILFHDEKAKLQMNVSPGWLPVRINQTEYYDAFSLPEAADPAVQAALAKINDLDPNFFRLFIYDLQDGHHLNGFVTNINVIWNIQGTINLNDDRDIKNVAESLPTSVPNLTVKSTSIGTTVNAIPYGVVLSEIPGKTDSGADILLVQKQVYLNLSIGSLVLTFTTDDAIKDATMPFFDSMVDSLQIMQ